MKVALVAAAGLLLLLLLLLLQGLPVLLLHQRQSARRQQCRQERAPAGKRRWEGHPRPGCTMAELVPNFAEVAFWFVFCSEQLNVCERVLWLDSKVLVGW